MEDDKIVDLFFERSEKAIDELSKKYGKVCMQVSLNALGNLQDAQECVNDSYLAVWNKIPPEKPKNLSAFVCKIVRNLSIKKYVHNNAKKRKGNYSACLDELKSCLPSYITSENEFELSDLTEIINVFLENLDYTNRLLFVRRYWYMDSYSLLSKETGLSQGAIRTRLTRVKSDLKKELERVGVGL